VDVGGGGGDVHSDLLGNRTSTTSTGRRKLKHGESHGSTVQRGVNNKRGKPGLKAK